jgi:hypothetical protein
VQYVFRAGLLTLLLATSPGLAQSANEPSAAGKQPDLGAGQRGPGDKSKGEDEGPDTEDMFGFTVGTDVIEPGRLEVSGEAVSRLGKRLGRYQADAFRSTVTFAPIEGLSIEPGVIGHHFSIRNVSGLDNRSFTGFGGVSAEIKWRILKRGDPSPFGLTLLAQPRMGLLDESSGERGRSQGLETRLLLDTALIPNTVYASLNVIYEMDKFRPRGVNLFSSKGEELARIPRMRPLTRAQTRFGPIGPRRSWHQRAGIAFSWDYQGPAALNGPGQATCTTT